MTLIHIDLLDTTSLACTTSTIDDTVTDDDLKSTIYTSLTSTLTSSGPRPYVDIHMTHRYLDSLSDTQLVQMEKLLEQKEKEMFTIPTQLGEQNSTVQVEQLGQQVAKTAIEQPKVYQKTKNV